MPSIPAPALPSLLFSTDGRELLRRLLAVVVLNPFSPEWRAATRALLGASGPSPESVRRLHAEVEAVLDAAREKLTRNVAATTADLVLYEEACMALLYYGCGPQLSRVVDRKATGPDQRALFDDFTRDHAHWLHAAGGQLSPLSARHLLLHFFALYRAFHFIDTTIAGTSDLAEQLRMDVWESIAGDNLRLHLYARADRLQALHTLVLGPTGSGKELVAQAIGRAFPVPFDEAAGRFAWAYDDRFRALHLGAKAPSLLEAQLFGHAKGAFTGADEARTGDLDMGKEGGVLFLDELAEIPEHTQAVMLRVIESGELSPVGSLERRPFTPRIVAATHENLRALLAAGRLREDFLHRIQVNVVETPSLRAMLDQAPGDLELYVRSLAAREVAPGPGDWLAEKALRSIGRELPPDHPWSGNLRELRDWVRALVARRHGPVIRRTALPSATPANANAARVEAPPSSRSPGADDPAFRAILGGAPSLKEVTRRLIAWHYAQCHNLRQVGRALGIDPDTVKAKLDDALVAQFEQLLARRKR